MLRFGISFWVLIGLLNVVSASLLECRMIESVCNGERACLETMQTRFPECLMPIQKRFWENDFGTNKRALKLMNILMKVDRIPVG